MIQDMWSASGTTASSIKQYLSGVPQNAPSQLVTAVPSITTAEMGKGSFNGFRLFLLNLEGISDNPLTIGEYETEAQNALTYIGTAYPDNVNILTVYLQQLLEMAKAALSPVTPAEMYVSQITYLTTTQAVNAWQTLSNDPKLQSMLPANKTAARKQYTQFPVPNTSAWQMVLLGKGLDALALADIWLLTPQNQLSYAQDLLNDIPVETGGTLTDAQNVEKQFIQNRINDLTNFLNS